MKLRNTATIATLGAILSLPVSLAAQDYALLHQVSQSAHDRAEREQTQQDHRKHTGVKIIGGSAAGGAAIGALAGGGKGALIGGAVGAGGGAIANKVRKDRAVRKREQRDEYNRNDNSNYRHHSSEYPR